MAPRVSIRTVRPGDAPELERFYARLSSESRRRRFLGTSRGISGPEARHFAAARERGGAGFIALRGERIVAHACVEPCAPGVVEMAFAVADDWQRQGIGRALLMRALAWTQRHGIARIDLSFFADNLAMRRMLGSVTGSLAVRPDGSVEQVELVLPAAA